MLGYPLTGAGANPVSDTGTFPHRSQERQMSFVPPCVSPQGAEAYPAGCHPSIESTGQFVLPRFNPATDASYYASSNSALRGSENFRSVPAIADEGATRTDHVMATNWSKDGFNVALNPSYSYRPSITRFRSIRSQQSGANHRYALPEAMPQGRAPLTCVHKTTSAFTVPLTPSGIPHFSPVTLSRDQVTSRDRPRQSRQLDKEPAMAFPALRPASSSRSAGTRKAPKGPYSCKNCHQTFTCRQVLNRHWRTIHEPEWCIICGNFKWARPYLLKDHLSREHPEYDTEAVLAYAKARRRVTMTSSLSTHRQDSPSMV